MPSNLKRIQPVRTEVAGHLRSPVAAALQSAAFLAEGQIGRHAQQQADSPVEYDVDQAADSGIATGRCGVGGRSPNLHGWCGCVLAEYLSLKQTATVLIDRVRVREKIQ